MQVQDTIHVASEAAGEVADEVAQPNAPVVNEVVQPDAHIVDEVASTNRVPTLTTDTKVTTSSKELFMHTDGAFPKGPIDRSVLTEYDDHVACRLWQREVYIFYV